MPLVFPIKAINPTVATALHVERFNVDVTSSFIELFVSYGNVVDNIYTKNINIPIKRYTFSGVDFIFVANQSCDGTLNLFDNLKEIIFKVLRSKGLEAGETL